MSDNSELFKNWEAQMEEVQPLGTSDGLHLFFGAVQAISMLRANTVDVALSETNEKWKQLSGDGVGLGDLFDADTEEGRTQFADWVTDTAKDAVRLIEAWLLEHELHDGVELIVFMPCHQSYSTMAFRPKATT